jgi:hypothetical protein
MSGGVGGTLATSGRTGGSAGTMVRTRLGSVAARSR